MAAPLAELDSAGRLRYWRKVQVPSDHLSDCWEWLAAKDANGYGRFGVSGKRTRLAHHVAYFMEHNVDPAGFVVMHSCDNPSCVSPHHLILGTHAANVADKVAKRRHSGATHTGEAHGRTRLTDEQAEVVHRLLSLGYGPTHLARVFGCSVNPILSIRNGHRPVSGTTDWKAS